MSFALSQRLLRPVAFLLWMLAVSASAQFLPFVATDEQKALNFAERSFKDGLYDVAQSKLTEFQETYPKSASIPQVRWLLGQTLYFNGQYQKALDLFQAPPPDTSDDLLPGYLFWEAETLSALDKWKEAEGKYNTLIKKYPNYEHLTLARIGLANSLYGQDKKQEALDLLTDLRLAGLKDPDAQRAALLQTKMLITEQRLKEAREILDQLNKQKLNPPLIFESFHWTGELALRQDDLDAAASAFDKIVNDPRATPVNWWPCPGSGWGKWKAAGKTGRKPPPLMKMLPTLPRSEDYRTRHCQLSRRPTFQQQPDRRSPGDS